MGPAEAIGSHSWRHQTRRPGHPLSPPTQVPGSSRAPVLAVAGVVARELSNGQIPLRAVRSC